MYNSKKERPIYVIGHKNPDTDSICSAIAYADLKNRSSDGTYKARRAGEINEETEFVLKYFDVQPPGYLPNAGMQVRDMEFHETPGAGSRITVKEAWNLMSEASTMTLPITDGDDHLLGLITVGDIAKYYMNVKSNTIMAEARTQYRAIAETLEGRLVTGNEHGYFIRGKVLVGAAQPERLKEAMDPDDLVILSDREDAQLMAIGCGASCLILCMVEKPSDIVLESAEKNECVIITTHLDTYTASRLIDQSIPVDHLMTKANIVSFHTRDFVDDIRDTMGRLRHRDFPVLDHKDRYVGTVSRRNLMNVDRKKLILVDHSEVSQAADNLDQADILEIIDHHRIGTVETIRPIYFRGEPVGCTATIIYQIYKEKDLTVHPTIAGLLCAAILSDTLMFRSPTCTERDRLAAEELAEIAGIEIEKFAKEMFKAGSNLSGKPTEAIFYQDFKKFIFDGVSFGVGQISSMSPESLLEIKERLLPFMAEEAGRNGLTMIFFMLTNILTEETELLYVGEGAEQLIEEALHLEARGGSINLPGVVSRKKQLIPAFMVSLQMVEG